MTPDPDDAPLTPQEEREHDLQGEQIRLHLQHEREDAELPLKPWQKPPE